MIKENAKKIEKALGLQRKIIGVRFLYNWAEFQDAPCNVYSKKTRFCVMMKYASEGNHFKCSPDNFGCGRSKKALGITPNDTLTSSGQIFYSCDLYSTRAIAKQAQDATLFIEQSLYGIEVAPLDEILDPDIVIFFGNAYQMMRIIHGYTYHMGAFQSMSSVGNQGVCSDLCARPFMTNDMNISFLCEGARRACHWSHDDIGVGLPINLFTPLADGILRTLDLIETNDEKEKILSRLSSEDELGISIHKNNYYGVSCSNWYQKMDEDNVRYEEFLNQGEK